MLVQAVGSVLHFGAGDGILPTRCCNAVVDTGVVKMVQKMESAMLNGNKNISLQIKFALKQTQCMGR